MIKCVSEEGEATLSAHTNKTPHFLTAKTLPLSLLFGILVCFSILQAVFPGFSGLRCL